MSINASSNSQEPKLAAGVLPAGTIQGLNMDASGNLLTAPGTVTVQSTTQMPAISGGASLAKVLSAATTNATSAKASAGQLYSFAFFNVNAAARYVHFYNKASAPTVGTDVPVFTVGVPIGGSVTWHDINGTPFALGIAYAITTGAGDTDTGAVGANDVTGFFTYK